MDYIDLRKLSRDGLKQVRRQVVRLKELGKTGKEIEELVGVRQNRISEIWTAYQREGEAALEPGRNSRKPGKPLLLSPEEQAAVREAILTKKPQDFGIDGQLWTLDRAAKFVRLTCQKEVAARTMSSYMGRWGLNSRRM